MLFIEQDSDKAKNIVREIVCLNDNFCVSRWLDTENVRCVVNYKDESKTVPMCVALIHNVVIDPLKIARTSISVCYIYTLDEYRTCI